MAREGSGRGRATDHARGRPLHKNLLIRYVISLCWRFLCERAPSSLGLFGQAPLEEPRRPEPTPSSTSGGGPFAQQIRRTSGEIMVSLQPLLSPHMTDGPDGSGDYSPLQSGRTDGGRCTQQTRKF
jgi:hypothetical protein